jgi:hypothetical protein
MAVNIFEGARRIAIVLGALWALGCGAAIIWFSPYLRLDYEASQPGTRPIRVAANYCTSTERPIAVVNPAGHRITGSICFRTEWNGQEAVVPYEVRGAGVVSAGPNTPEVQSYATRVRDSLNVSASELEALDREWSDRWWENAKMWFEVGAGGLVLGWLFISLIGWIVRGFLGIPSGRDSRVS